MQGSTLPAAVMAEGSVGDAVSLRRGQRFATVEAEPCEGRLPMLAASGVRIEVERRARVLIHVSALR